MKGKGDMKTYFLTDRKQLGTIRVEDLANYTNHKAYGNNKLQFKESNKIERY